MNAHSRGLGAVLMAQFLSSLADNSLLFGAIALLAARGAPAWHTPLLQEFFLLACILMAPFVGPLADAFPKGRVMLASNGLKLAGALAMVFGAEPLLSYALVGAGAAAYSPAKYGILSDLVSRDKLVKANGMLESSNSAAILLGVVMGGYLVDHGAHFAVAVTAGMYALAAVANLYIPAIEPPAQSAGKRHSPRSLYLEFSAGVRTLLQNHDGRLILLGTSIFVGTGSMLRFLLVAWVPAALGIGETSTPAMLSGVVAVGIAVGAAAAARTVSLAKVNRALPAGLGFGLLIMALAPVTSLAVSVGLLFAIGACGGFYVVPHKALLQQCGQDTIGAGSAVSVQNICGNITMMLMMGLFALMARVGMPPAGMAMSFGALVFTGIAAVALGRRRNPAPC